MDFEEQVTETVQQSTQPDALEEPLDGTDVVETIGDEEAADELVGDESAGEESADEELAGASFRFSLANMFLLTMTVAIAFAWWNDHNELNRRIDALESMDSPWGTNQVTGPPDTAGAGDIQTAWASASPDGQAEWLMLEYENAVRAKSVDVYETYNPGALVKVSVFDETGTEVVAWQGTDPTAKTKDRGVSTVPINVNFKVRRVKLYLDSANVSGWNEIDAVGLISRGNTTQWAVQAYASSSFGKNNRQSGTFVFGGLELTR